MDFKNTTMNYELTKKALKNGKYLYQVVDEKGNVMSQRISARDYVACTLNGEMFFGRLDLIGKGEHAKMLARINEYANSSKASYCKVVNERVKAAQMDLACHRQYDKGDVPEGHWFYKIQEECKAKEGVSSMIEYYEKIDSPERVKAETEAELGDVESWMYHRKLWAERKAEEMKVVYMK